MIAPSIMGRAQLVEVGDREEGLDGDLVPAELRLVDGLRTDEGNVRG
jgi:hypothetical protein